MSSGNEQASGGSFSEPRFSGGPGAPCELFRGASKDYARGGAGAFLPAANPGHSRSSGTERVMPRPPVGMCDGDQHAITI